MMVCEGTPSFTDNLKDIYLVYKQLFKFKVLHMLLLHTHV